MNQIIPVYWEDFFLGQKVVTQARTITEADVVMFAALTGDYNPLHTDSEFGKATMFGQRIAHGMLGLSVAVGLAALIGIGHGTIMAFLGLTWDFTGPILLGDTIHVEQTVINKRETKNLDRGIVEWDLQIVNQRGEVVQKGQHKLLMKRIGVEAGAVLAQQADA